MLKITQSSYCVRTAVRSNGLLASAALAACAFLAAGSAELRANPASETTIYSFNGSQTAPSADGASPISGLLVGLDGSLYGTTQYGGTSGAGTVFRLIPPGQGHSNWTETVIYSFAGSPNDGANPFLGRQSWGLDGSLYGFAENGGATGYGVVYRLTPPKAGQGNWTETVLYNFGTVANDGLNPTGHPVFWLDGNIYGTTFEGGTFGRGTVFKLSAPSRGQTQWTESTVYDFGVSAVDAFDPQGGLALGLDLGLYGTAPYGGRYGYGAVFKLTPSGFFKTTWTESVLYSFAGPPNDGANPQAAVTFDFTGGVYGTTSNGGTGNLGTVFRLAPPPPTKTSWTEGVLYSFNGYPNDGQNPFAGVVFGLNGVLYGTTIAGGASDFGTVFELVPPRHGQGNWTESTLYSFTASGSDGAYPYGGVTFDWDGALYGTTLGGGSGASGGGTAYRVSQFF
jgi:uncharacterized repeat protein (TIGR03803 family)